MSQGWAAAGFGARFVDLLLSVGPDGEEELGSFLGYTPELPASQPPVDLPTAVQVVGVDRVSSGYWAVTVAATRGGREEFWRVGVAVAGEGRLTVTGFPTPVAAPATERADLAVSLSGAPAGDDPAVRATEGFARAYACGDGDLSRWLRPGTALAQVRPPLCRELRLERWGSEEIGEDRLEVAAELVLDPGPAARRIALGVVLARRDGRWEVAELLPAPRLATSRHGRRR